MTERLRIPPMTERLRIPLMTERQQSVTVQHQGSRTSGSPTYSSEGTGLSSSSVAKIAMSVILWFVTKQGPGGLKRFLLRVYCRYIDRCPSRWFDLPLSNLLSKMVSHAARSECNTDGIHPWRIPSIGTTGDTTTIGHHIRFGTAP